MRLSARHHTGQLNSFVRTVKHVLILRKCVMQQRKSILYQSILSSLMQTFALDIETQQKKSEFFSSQF